MHSLDSTVGTSNCRSRHRTCSHYAPPCPTEHDGGVASKRYYFEKNTPPPAAGPRVYADAKTLTPAIQESESDRIIPSSRAASPPPVYTASLAGGGARRRPFLPLPPTPLSTSPPPQMPCRYQIDTRAVRFRFESRRYVERLLACIRVVPFQSYTQRWIWMTDRGVNPPRGFFLP